MSKLRSQFYRGARDLGNVEAAEHGFERHGVAGIVTGSAKRYGRRCVYRGVNRECSHRLCRLLGLQ